VRGGANALEWPTLEAANASGNKESSVAQGGPRHTGFAVLRAIAQVPSRAP